MNNITASVGYFRIRQIYILVSILDLQFKSIGIGLAQRVGHVTG